MAAIDELKEEHDNRRLRPAASPTPDGKPIEYTFFRPQQYGEKYIIKEWPSFNAMLEGYYAEKDRAERLRTKSKELHKAVHNMYERAVRKQAARQEELAASGKSEKLRLYGELLSANLYLAQKGMKSITVPELVRRGQRGDHPAGPAVHPQPERPELLQELQKEADRRPDAGGSAGRGRKGDRLSGNGALRGGERLRRSRPERDPGMELKNQGYLKYYKQRDKRQKPADFLRFTVQRWL